MTLNGAGSRAAIPAHRVRRLIFQAVSLPAVVLALVCALLVWQVTSLQALNDQTVRAQRVIAQLNLAQKLLLDQETGLRAYLLTGDPIFLDPFRKGAAQLPGTLDDLELLIDNSAVQRWRIGDLRGRTIRWKDLADAALKIALENPSWEGRAWPTFRLDMHARKAEMDAMRAIVGDLIAHEERQVGDRQARARRQARVILGGSAVAALFFGVIMAMALRRWIGFIEQTYKESLEARAKSEDREREARQAAEGLAAEITDQCRAMERAFKEVREERDAALRRVEEARPE